MRRRRIIGPSFPYLATPVVTATAPSGVQINQIGSLQYIPASSGLTADYTGLTIAGGLTNSALLVFVFNGDPANLAINTVAATWDQGGTNQAMTALISAAGPATNGPSIWTFGLLNPTAGNKTLRVTWLLHNSRVDICAISFSGVNQGSIAAAFPNTANDAQNNSGPMAVTVFSGIGHKVFGGWTEGNNPPGSPTGTLIFAAVDSFYNTLTYTDGASPTVTMSATLASGQEWAEVVVDVSP